MSIPLEPNLQVYPRKQNEVWLMLTFDEYYWDLLVHHRSANHTI